MEISIEELFSAEFAAVATAEQGVSDAKAALVAANADLTSARDALSKAIQNSGVVAKPGA